MPKGIAAIAKAAWEFVQNLLPIEKWIQAITSVLRYFSYAFLLMVGLIVTQRYWGSGLSSNQRFTLDLVIFILMGIALLIVLILAAKQGDLLLSPYERSLGRGKNYGIKGAEKTRQEIMKEPTTTQVPELPPSANQEVTGT